MRVATRLRRLAGTAVEAAGRALDPSRPHAVRLSDPPSARPGPRYGYGRPQHPRILEVLARHDATYGTQLDELLAFSDDLVRIPRHPKQGEPCWLNAWLLGLDTVSLYGYLRARRPRHYVEVGSGFSTLLADRARRDGGFPMRITSIDPQPRADVDAVCDEVVRQPLELTDLDRLTDLGPDDLLFVDASHRVFSGSDMVAFYLDALPELQPGLLVAIHDILWPDDYLPEWTEYWFSEQYLLGAYLMAEAPWIRPLLACNYVSGHAELQHRLDPLWERPELEGVDPRGFAFWFTVGD